MDEYGGLSGVSNDEKRPSPAGYPGATLQFCRGFPRGTLEHLLWSSIVTYPGATLELPWSTYPGAASSLETTKSCGLPYRFLERLSKCSRVGQRTGSFSTIKGL